MEECELENEKGETSGIYINGISYSYSITKSEKDNSLLIIKLYDSTNNSKIYYTYEGDISKLKGDIKYLEFFESLDEIIISLKDIFDKGNAEVEKVENIPDFDIYNLKLKLIISGITKICTIKLNKHDTKPEPFNELKDKITKLENKYDDLLKKYEELKIIKESEIKKIVKEVFDKDIKFKFLDDLEKLKLSKYNQKNIHEDENKNDNKIKTNMVEDNNILNLKKVKSNNPPKIDKFNKYITDEEIIDETEKIKNNIDEFFEFNNYLIIYLKQ